jgi:peptidyl-dipeptidase A
MSERSMELMAKLIKESEKFRKVKLSPELERQLLLLRIADTFPPPDDAKARSELAQLSTELSSIYGKGEHCYQKAGKKVCGKLDDLTKELAQNRDEAIARDIWVGWHKTGAVMRDKYAREVELANAGAKALGFKDLSELWKSGYDMKPQDFEAETDRLWTQLRPLYEQLHCYVRAKLHAKYGDKVPDKGPIPAHLLGNMWAQEWANIYSLVEPFKGEASIDVSKAIVKQKWDAVTMVKKGEQFFTSLGFDPLPQTFWTRSLFTRPRDREVVCHASAWDVAYDNDVRIKMCIQPTEEDFVTVHHELGHIFYYQRYHKLPVLFQQGANDGFHEAIGDALALSIGPDYLDKVGLIKKTKENEKALINQQMKSALEKIAFLPFGLLLDRWRWEVFSGRTTKANYNARFWELRKQYQGVAPPVERTEADFDPGAKYHIPANVPYTRYFLARILQFQFHRGLCKAAGHTGPLHTCSIYGNAAAGEKLKAMLSLGASQPWPRALESITGETAMDATALVDYFQPLMTWLQKDNAGRSCGY